MVESPSLQEDPEILSGSQGLESKTFEIFLMIDFIVAKLALKP